MIPPSVTPEEAAVINMARATLSTRSGQAFLAWMLQDCGAFDPYPVSEDHIALRNWCMKLLRLLAGGSLAIENVQHFTMQLMKQPFTVKKKEGEV